MGGGSPSWASPPLVQPRTSVLSRPRRSAASRKNEESTEAQAAADAAAQERASAKYAARHGANGARDGHAAARGWDEAGAPFESWRADRQAGITTTVTERGGMGGALVRTLSADVDSPGGKARVAPPKAIASPSLEDSPGADAKTPRRRLPSALAPIATRPAGVGTPADVPDGMMPRRAKRQLQASAELQQQYDLITHCPLVLTPSPTLKHTPGR